MRVHVRVMFGVMSSPSVAFGTADGDLFLNQIPKKGENLLIDGLYVRNGTLTVPFALCVLDIRPAGDDGSIPVKVDDYVAIDQFEAEIIMSYLETRLGFYTARFDEFDL